MRPAGPGMFWFCGYVLQNRSGPDMTQPRRQTPECGSKHLKLAGLIVGLVSAMCGGSMIVSHSIVSAHECDTLPRIRALETQYGRIDERLSAIQEDMRDVKADVRAMKIVVNGHGVSRP